ncbi:Uma2 family endonuclease [Phormidesmis priestleyi]
MSVAVKPMTLEEYLTYDDGTDTRYELVNGELIAMPTESTLNIRIATFLLAHFLYLDIPVDRLAMRAQIAVSGARSTAREPDLMVLSEETATALDGATHCLITHEMPPPLLVVEVVSPKQEDRDYRYKRTEYAGRQIPEYWIVDPIAQRVTLLEWVNGLYEERVYQGQETIVSVLFPTFDLTAEQLLKARR